MIIIVNKREKLYEGEPFKIYCGRPSILGNVYSAKKYGREPCIKMFRNFLYRMIQDKAPDYSVQEFRDELHRLLDIHKQYNKLVLECWCAKGEITTKDKPYVCHGQVIAEYLEKHLL